MNIISSVLLSILGLSVFSQPPVQEKRIVRSPSTQTFVVCYYSVGAYYNINSDFEITTHNPDNYGGSSDHYIYYDQFGYYNAGSKWIAFWNNNIYPMYYYKSDSSIMEAMNLDESEISSWSIGAVSTTIEATPILRELEILNKPSSEQKFKFGDTYQLNIKRVPYYASEEITFSSHYEDVATVDSNGLVTFRPSAEYAVHDYASISIANNGFLSDYCYFALEEYPEHRIHLPTQTTFARGETFNHDGLKYEIYNSETGYSYFFESQLYVVTPNMNVEGWHEVDVYLEEPAPDVHHSDFTYNIYIHDPSIDVNDDPFYQLLSIDINTNPNKVFFTESEEFTYEGLSIKAYFGNETNHWQEIYYTGFSVAHEDFDHKGFFAVTITFHGKEAKYLVGIVDEIIECNVGETLPITPLEGYHFFNSIEYPIYEGDDFILSESTDDGKITALAVGQTFLHVEFDPDAGSGRYFKLYGVIITNNGSGGGSGSDDGSGGGSGGEGQGGNGSSSNNENKQDNMLVGIIAGSAAAVIVAGALIIIITVSVKKKKAKNS